MKNNFSKYVVFIAMMAMVALSSPFIVITNEFKDDSPNGNGHTWTTRDKFTGIDIIIESAQKLFDGGYAGNKLVLVLLLFLGITAVLQFVAALLKRFKVVSYTAVVLFAASFTTLLFIIKNDGIDIVRYGYYVHMVLQVLLILFAGNKKIIKTAEYS